VKLLVTGAGGLLGGEFARTAPGLGHDVTAAGHRDLDITDPDAVRAALRARRPDVVVNCAARADVDRVEGDPAAALRVNRDGPALLAEAASQVGARLVHFSTDYVFDGHATAPYPPRHPVAPVNVYARSKAAGEAAVLDVPGGHLVVRVSWLFGASERGLVPFVAAAARSGRPLRLVEDQRSRPTWSRNAVVTVLDLLREDVGGIWHVADGGDASRREEALEVLSVLGLSVPIETITRAEMWPDVPRPAYTVLDLSATEALLGRPMMPWRTSIREVLGR
jgi:dTDP-4-dehydrorhamnose reductase